MTESLHDTETLDKLLAKSASDWTEADRLALVNALRDQRERWNTEQKAGTRKRVTAKATPAPRAKRDLAFEGLKL